MINQVIKKEIFGKRNLDWWESTLDLFYASFYFGLNFFIFNTKQLVHNDEIEPHFPMNYILVSLHLHHIYYLCNPLWYVTLNYDVKREMKKVFRWKKGFH